MSHEKFGLFGPSPSSLSSMSCPFLHYWKVFNKSQNPLTPLTMCHHLWMTPNVEIFKIQLRFIISQTFLHHCEILDKKYINKPPRLFKYQQNGIKEKKTSLWNYGKKREKWNVWGEQCVINIKYLHFYCILWYRK